VTPGTAIRTETVDQAILETEHRAVLAAPGRALASSGVAVPDTQIRIRRDGKACSDGETGEIEIKSSFLMQGYVGVGEGVTRPIEDGWFRTGDLGYLRDGQLFVIGRIKDIIIRAGRNIDPSYIEASLAGIAGLKPGRWVVFGLYNPKDGTEDVILLAEGDGTAEVKAIKAAIVKACNVQTGIAPQKIEVVDANWLVKSSSGKISRTACRKKYVETFVSA
jgi:acyl-CoA synthetase (AMP-forming)/AMP-acid ligase II